MNNFSLQTGQSIPSISKDISARSSEAPIYNTAVQKLTNHRVELSCEAARILNQLPILNFMQAKTLIIPNEPILKH